MIPHHFENILHTFFSSYVSLSGGYREEALASCEMYDLHSDRWSNISPLNFARDGPGVVSLHNAIYAAGLFTYSSAPESSLHVTLYPKLIRLYFFICLPITLYLEMLLVYNML